MHGMRLSPASPMRGRPTRAPVCMYVQGGAGFGSSADSQASQQPPRLCTHVLAACLEELMAQNRWSRTTQDGSGQRFGRRRERGVCVCAGRGAGRLGCGLRCALAARGEARGDEAVQLQGGHCMPQRTAASSASCHHPLQRLCMTLHAMSEAACGGGWWEAPSAPLRSATPSGRCMHL